MLANYFFLFPAQTPNVLQVDFVRLVVFGLVVTLISLIHERHKRTMTALRQSRDQLNLYLRDMANGVIVQDKTAG